MNFCGVVCRMNDDNNEVTTHKIKLVANTATEESRDEEDVKQEVKGHSGGMLYCYAGDPNKLVPFCMITQEWDGRAPDHSHNLKWGDSLRDLLEHTRKILDGRSYRQVRESVEKVVA
ncbi:hypothetical protein L914_15718 [Phytophthora nicotianae]|uniref:Uncharacterized protein n=2 Tax=Phytophthora nicotianae TaxID=4792 RepID=V9F0S7_PHYNI|nr:hypothetical protein F443_10619 [Phytophthora nicotianae P1569]ETM37855.1 hypothetical protein L914_15718 [Phytophthora nicotianae]